MRISDWSSYVCSSDLLDFLPFAACHVLPDKQQQARCEAGMLAFNAPYCMRMLELDAGAMYDTTAEAQGKVFVTTELGGGGSSTGRSVALAERGRTRKWRVGKEGVRKERVREAQ